MGGAEKKCKVDIPSEWVTSFRENLLAPDGDITAVAFLSGGQLLKDPRDSKENNVYWMPDGGSNKVVIASLEAGSGISGAAGNDKYLAFFRGIGIGVYKGAELFVWQIGSSDRAKAVWQTPRDEKGANLANPPVNPIVYGNGVYWAGSTTRKGETDLFFYDFKTGEIQSLVSNIGLPFGGFGQYLIGNRVVGGEKLSYAYNMDTRSLGDMPYGINITKESSEFNSDGTYWATLSGQTLVAGDRNGPLLEFVDVNDKSMDLPWMSDGFVAVSQRHDRYFYLIDLKERSYTRIPYPYQLQGGVAMEEMGKIQSIVPMSKLPRLAKCGTP